MKEWIKKQIRKSAIYQEMKQEFAENATHIAEQAIDKLESARGFIADVSRTNSAVMRLLDEQVMIATDVHFKQESVIVVISRLKGGCVQFIPAKFGSYTEMLKVVNDIRDAFGVREDHMVWDEPPMFKDARRRSDGNY